MFFFSIHPNEQAVGQHGLTAKGFIVKVCQDMEMLGNFCQRYMNSPTVWKCGIRKKENFMWSQFAVLDVDEGLSLRQAMQEFAPYVHLIGTTKSHQKLKGEKVCDRFRVFVALNDKTKSAEDYHETNKKLAEKFGGDLQACGPHMSFMPLREIVAVNNKGKTLEIEKAPPVKLSHFRVSTIDSVKRQIPNYIQRWLQFGAPEGERNITCFKVACGLLKVGFYEDEIINMLLSSAIPIAGSEDVAREIRQTVRSAARKTVK